MHRIIFAIGLVLFAAAPLRATDSDWFLIDARHQAAASNPNHPAYQKLLERDRPGRPPPCLAFTPNDDWVLLPGGTEYWSSSLELPLCRKLRALQKESGVRAFRSVSFSPGGGWVLLYDRRFAADGVSEALTRKLRELTDANTLPRSVAFPPGGGWIVVAGPADVQHDGIPAPLARVLDDLRAKATPIDGIAFTTAGDWFICTCGDGLRTNRPEHAAAQKLGKDGGWLTFAPGVAPEGYTLLAAPGRRIKAKLTMKLALPGVDVSEWLIYAPHAPTFDGQHDVKATLTPDGRLAHDLSALRRPLLASRLQGRGDDVQLVLSVEATLIGRRLLPRVPGTETPPVADLPAADVKLYTRATPTLELTARPFVEWLTRHELRRGKAESDLAFARRVYSFIKHQFEYEYRRGQDMHPTAVCRDGKSDCGGLSALFVATLRAGGVPARLLQGRWARSEQPGVVVGGFAYKQWHIQSEFFAKGIGWVPVDVAAAVTDRGRGELGCFGNDLGDFLTLHLDQDLVFPTLNGGRDSRFGVQAIAFWYRGKGAVPKERYEEAWTVE